jgi:hypothetical protein
MVMTGEIKKTRRLTAAFFFVSMAVFAQCAGFGFIGLDDAGYTFRNPFVATGFSLANLSECFANLRHGGIWMPLTYLSYILDVEASDFFGIKLAAWMHSVNVAVHAANLVLLLGLVMRLSAARGKPAPVFLVFAAAAFWAFHPMRAEPVAWIACRKELLWVLFALAGLRCWLKALTAGTGGDRLAVFAVAFCVAACLSKPTAMCFPLLAGMVQLALSGSGIAVAFPRRRLWLAYLPMLAAAAATALIAAYSQTHVAGQDSTSLFAAPLHHRIVHALSALGFYLRSTVLPYGLHVDCRSAEGWLPPGGVANLATVAVALSAAAWFFVRRKAWRPSPGTVGFWFALLWFALPLAPTLGLFGSFGIEAHADRFTYLPAMAVVFLAALSPEGGFAEKFTTKKMRLMLVLAVAAYAASGFRQTRFWRDDHTAHLRALACDPVHPRAMVHVGDALCAQFRDYDGGIALYRRSMELRPREYVKYRLAYALASRGKWADFQEVKRLGADVAAKPSLDRRGMMLDALGTAYMADGDWEKAAELFKASIAAPGRFWPKASTRRKLEECLERIK